MKPIDDKRTIRNILVKVKKHLMTNTDYAGLCEIAYFELHTLESVIFLPYLHKHRPKRNYNGDGVLMKKPVSHSNYFFWKPYQKTYRLKWLNKHIKLNS